MRAQDFAVGMLWLVIAIIRIGAQPFIPWHSWIPWKEKWQARILANLAELVSHYGGNGHGKTIVRFSNTRNIEQTPSHRTQVVNRWD